MTERWKILVASADQAMMLALAKAIRLEGWDHVLAGDAAHALAQARRAQPQAVVLDARLPGGGALVTLRRLRASPHTAGLPVVVTGTAGAAHRDELLAAGARGSVDDPRDAPALVARLREALAAPPAVPALPVAALADPLRLAAVRASGLLDSPAEQAFDRVTDLAATLLSTPTAMISLLDRERQFFKSQIGLPADLAARREIPLTHSFCPWVVAGREPVWVRDTRELAHLRGHPALTDLGVIAYTGVPISTGQGVTLGSLCAIDSRPRDWSDQDIATLTDLSRMAECCVARVALGRQPPATAGELDHYVEATGAALQGALGILRRRGGALLRETRDRLYDAVEEYAHQLVQMNRLIQVQQALG